MRRVSYCVKVFAAVASREAIVEESCPTDKCQESSIRLVQVVSAPLVRETVMTVPTPALTIEIDRQQPVPIYLQICERFRTAIAAGHLRPGDRVPALRSLATQLNTARGTVELAYTILVDEGYLQVRGAAGTVVSPSLPASMTRSARAQSARDPNSRQNAKASVAPATPGELRGADTAPRQLAIAAAM